MPFLNLDDKKLTASCRFYLTVSAVNVFFRRFIYFHQRKCLLVVPYIKPEPQKCVNKTVAFDI